MRRVEVVLMVISEERSMGLKRDWILNTHNESGWFFKDTFSDTFLCRRRPNSRNDRD